METTVDSILSGYEARVQELGFRVREFLLKNLEDITEQPDGPANIIGYGYWPGYKDSICALIPSKKGIKIGFNKGATLPDPDKLLAGTGKVHKYVAINTVDDLENPALTTLIQEALNRYKETKRT